MARTWNDQPGILNNSDAKDPRGKVDNTQDQMGKVDIEMNISRMSKKINSGDQKHCDGNKVCLR